jgi:drug/metabolite transporter (DMT)-like permease
VNPEVLKSDGRPATATAVHPILPEALGGPSHAQRRAAAWMLVLCSFLWGTSFPTVHALGLLQLGQFSEGARSTWFFASLTVTVRFGLSAAILALLILPRLRGMTRLEVRQGVEFGLFGAGGLLLQTDGLAHTSASTSAFLTQCYCVFIPVLVTLRDRRRPSALVLFGCAMVFAGVAVLSGLDLRTFFHDFHVGRGERETILSALFFSGQILWLEKPRYAKNDVTRFSLVGFVVMSLATLPVAIFTAPSADAPIRAYSSGAAVGFLAILVVICTLGGYMIMTSWQKYVPATRAGLIYCLEPVFTSVMAMVLPGLYSTWAGISYVNESVDWHLAVGGGLILAANLVVLLNPAPRARSPEP